MNILVAIACHFVGDFPFQPDWMASNKGTNYEILLYHCLTYASVFVLWGGASWGQALILLGSHFIIDMLKARWGIVKKIWVDQILHMLVIMGLFI
jgi:hypothetical protein